MDAVIAGRIYAGFETLFGTNLAYNDGFVMTPLSWLKWLFQRVNQVVKSV